MGEPPTARGDDGADTVGEDGPADDRVEVALGHLGDGLDVAGVLGDEGDDGGQHQQAEVQREARGGEVRQAEPVGVADGVEVDPVVLGRLGRAAEHRGDRAGRDVEQHREQVAEDQAEQDGDAGEEAAQRQRGRR